MNNIKIKTLLVVLSFFSVVLVKAQPLGYYNGTEGKSGAELKSALHDIISHHVDFSYNEAKYLINYSDADPNNPNNVILFYTQISRDASLYGTTAGSINREHVWAKSHGGFSGVRPMDSDALNLRPADAMANVSRSNLDFDNVKPNGTQNPYAPDCWSNDSAFEPGPMTKGQVARILFYMDTRYEGTDGEMDLQLVRKLNNYPAAKFGNLTTLLEWNRDYPPSALERQRNDRIFRMQQNRNPFVDHPEFADLIYDGATPTGTEFGNFSMSPELPNQDEEPQVSISISNVTNLSDVSLFWGNAFDAETHQTQMDLSGTQYHAKLSFAGYNAGDLIYLKVVATDGSGNKSAFHANYLLPEKVAASALTPINQVQGTDDSSPLLNQEVTISGRVTANFDNSFYLQTGNGKRSGVNVYGTLFTGKVGDSLVVRGTVSEYSGLTEIGTPTYSYNFMDNKPIAPITINTSQINEDYEGMLVKIENVTFKNGGTAVPDANASFTFSDEFGSSELYSSYTSRLVGKPLPLGRTTIVGIVSEHNGAYQILARDMMDLTLTSKTNDVYVQTNPVLIYPNPARETIQILSNNEIKSVSVFNLNGVEIFKKKGNISSFDVSGLPPGLYITKIESAGEKMYIRKFSKQ